MVYKASLSFVLFKKIIGVYLLYNAVLVFAVQQSQSALHIHAALLVWTSFLFRPSQSIE